MNIEREKQILEVLLKEKRVTVRQLAKRLHDLSFFCCCSAAKLFHGVFLPHSLRRSVISFANLSCISNQLPPHART
jgi:hypothetical protein